MISFFAPRKLKTCREISSLGAEKDLQELLLGLELAGLPLAPGVRELLLERPRRPRQTSAENARQASGPKKIQPYAGGRQQREGVWGWAEPARDCRQNSSDFDATDRIMPILEPPAVFCSNNC